MKSADKKLRVLYILALVAWLVVCIVASFSSGHSLAYHLGLFLFFGTLPVSINQIVGIIVNKEFWGNSMLYLTLVIVAIVALLMIMKDYVLATGAKFWIICVAVYFIPFLLRLALNTLTSDQ